MEFAKDVEVKSRLPVSGVKDLKTGGSTGWIDDSVWITETGFPAAEGDSAVTTSEAEHNALIPVRPTVA